jgi:AcrR family transcriptional regulator
VSTAEELAVTPDPEGRRSRARGPYRNGIERRRQLVDAAWTLFARHGYAQASLRDIAAEVGVSPAGILRLFGSKEELLIAVLERWELETDLLSDRVELGTGAEFFGAFGDLMRYHVEHPGLIELFLQLCTEATDPDHPASTWVRERYDRIVASAAENLATLQRAAGVEVLPPAQRDLEVRWLFAAMDGLELQWIAEPAVDLVGLSDALFDVTLQRWTGQSLGAPASLPPALGSGATPVPAEPVEVVVPGATVRGPYRNGIERRRQIVAEATLAFGRRGYAGASLREIADNVGVSAAALLRYFGSKENLLFAVLDHWDEVAGGRSAPGQGPKGIAYLENLRRAMAHHDENPGLVELLLTLCAEASDPQHPALPWVRNRYSRIVSEFDEALQQAAADGRTIAMDADSREFSARLVFAVMDGLELQWIADPTIDLGRVFAPFLDLCLDRWRTGS